MTSLTLDAGTLNRLQNLEEFMEIRDESGRVLGYFHPVESAADTRAATQVSPISDDELRRRQQQRTGKSLAEVLAKLASP